MDNRAPAFWILLSCLLFATLSALVKLAASGVSLPEIVFFRTLPAAVGLAALARLRGQRIATHAWRLHALRCAVGVTTMFVGFYAVSRLPLATATTLEYTTPLFMLAYMIVLARRRLTLRMALAMIGGFAGVVILMRPTLHTGQAVAFCAALCAAALAGVVYVLIRRLSEAGEPPWRIVLWNSLVATVVAAAMLPFAPRGSYDARTIAALAAVGIVGLGAQLTMTRAFATGPATLLASLQYSTVAFAAMYGVLVWNDELSVGSVLGLALIVMSGIVAVKRADEPMPVES